MRRIDAAKWRCPVFRSAPMSGTALVLATLLNAPAALAQTDATISLPPISIDARRDGSLTVPGVEEQRRNVFQTPGSVGFVDGEALKGTYANNLRDVLKDVPGVLVQTRYGQELRVSVRGSGIRAPSTPAASKSCWTAFR